MVKKSKFFCAKKKELIMLKSQADNKFWDSHWKKMVVGFFGDSIDDYIKLTRKYVFPKAKIIEGGCGLCGKLIALEEAGYHLCGVDFAEETVARVLAKYPRLDVRVADVKNLPFDNDMFEAYWSFGVIEHFWNGYNDILDEAHRVLKTDGVLFLTFPGMSRLRKIKAILKCYPRWNFKSQESPDGFYQFVLNQDSVCSTLEKHGFEVLECFQHNIKSGIKQELRLIWYALRLLNKVSPFLGKHTFAEISEKMLGHFGGHVSVIVAKK